MNREQIIEVLIEQMKNSSYEELVKTAKMSVALLLPHCKFLDERSDGFLFIAAAFEHALSIDGEISEKEKQFITDVFGDYSHLVEKWLPIRGGLTEVMFELLHSFAEIIPDAQVGLSSLVASLLACDNRVTVSEENFLRKLLG